MLQDITGAGKSYPVGTGNIPENIQQDYQFNLTTIKTILKKKNITTDQLMRDKNLLMNAMRALQGLYPNVSDAMKAKIDKVFDLLDKAGISLDAPMKNADDMAVAMNKMADIVDEGEGAMILESMDVEESMGVSATEDATTGITSDQSLTDQVKQDFVDYYIKMYQAQLQELGDQIEMTSEVVANLTRLMEIMGLVKKDGTVPDSNWPPTSNSDITNVPGLVDAIAKILDDTGIKVTVDKNSGKLVKDTKSNTGIPTIDNQAKNGVSSKNPETIGLGEYFKRQITKQPPDNESKNAYKIILEVGNAKDGKGAGTTGKITDAWLTQMKAATYTYPSVGELTKLGGEILDINNSFKEFLDVIDPPVEPPKQQLRYGPDTTDPAYKLNNVIKQIDQAFQPYYDAVARWDSLSPEEFEKWGGEKARNDDLQDTLATCAYNLLRDAQPNPLDPNANTFLNDLKDATTALTAFNQGKTDELNAASSDYRIFLTQAAKLLEDLRGITKTFSSSYTRGG